MRRLHGNFCPELAMWVTVCACEPPPGKPKFAQCACSIHSSADVVDVSALLAQLVTRSVPNVTCNCPTIDPAQQLTGLDGSTSSAKLE